MESQRERVAVVFWQPEDGLSQHVVDVLSEIGFRPQPLQVNEPIPRDIDFVFAYSPFGSLLPLAQKLIEIPPASRPDFIYWQIEPLPNPRLPDWVWNSLGRMRSQIERWVHKHRLDDPSPLLGRMMKRAIRFRYYGDLLWLSEEGVLSILTITSKWNAQLLRKKGLNPIVTHVGALLHPNWGMGMDLERDIPVLWLGKSGTVRRKRLLRNLRQELTQRDIELHVVDGVENPPVFGHERTILFNRSKIAVNLLRKSWDDNSIRLFLAAANRTLIVTEPVLPHTPFVPGVHMVTAEADRMVDAISYYLDHEAERAQIVEQAYRLVTEELTMQDMISNLMQHAIERRNR